MVDSKSLLRIPLFSELDEQELHHLRETMKESKFAEGETIIYEGDTGDQFHIITEGIVEYLTTDGIGEIIVVDDATIGDFFGELSMLSGDKKTLRVRAKTPVSTLMLERELFFEFLMSHPHAGIDILTVVARRLFRADELLKQSVIKNLNDVIDEKITTGQKIADRFASIMGSWRFIIIQSLFLVAWVTMNFFGWINSWDPYPFILLNLMLSFQAAYAAPIIMMSQNRQADKDRLAAEVDHDVNIKAEAKVSIITNRLDDLERQIQALHQDLLGMQSERLG